MTSKDLMPFGKFGPKRPGGAMTIGEVKRTEPDYVDWLINQDGFKEKNAALYKFFTLGEEATATPKELEDDKLETELLASMAREFAAWWKRNYGDRLRGSPMHIAYLRVAIEAWNAGAKFANDSTEADVDVSNQPSPYDAEGRPLF
jgi:hypothetical protein